MTVADTTHTPLNAEVLNKYQTAGDVANRALKFALGEMKAGALISEVCVRVDAEIEAMVAGLYKKTKGMIKGVAFPTAVSVNNILCHLSPAPQDPCDRPLRAGDLAKIELGVHIDGFPALVCHSAVVGATKEAPATGRAADLMQAAHLAAEAVVRLLAEGKTSADARRAVLGVCHDFAVAPIEGMMAHAVGKDDLAIDKTIVYRPAEAQARTLQEASFETGEVYCIDVAVSSGEGRTVSFAPATRTTIYAKNALATYALKLKTSRAVFSEILSKHGSMGFHTRTLEDQAKSRVAIAECVTHQLLQPYDVSGEKDESALTARFMFTAAIMPAGPLKLTDQQFSQDLVKPEASLKNPDLLALAQAPIRPAKKKAAALATA